jgi:hypothetical protein
MKLLTEFFTENNALSWPIKTAGGIGGSILAAISPAMHDAQWWVSFVIGAAVGLLSIISLGIGIYKQLKK